MDKSSCFKLKTWLVVGLLLHSFGVTAQVARNLDNVPANFKNGTANTDALKAAYLELYNTPGLADRGVPHVFKGPYLEAIQFPVGGIGAGCIQFNGDAVPRFWQIFNNMTHDFVPNSFFALRVKSKKETQVRALQTQNAGLFPKMAAVEASAAFPFLTYQFKDDLPLKVAMQVYNPFIPTNLKDSGIPAVFYRFTIENPTQENLEVNLLAAQQNAVGYSKVEKIGGGDSFAERFKMSLDRKIAQGNTSDYYGGNTNTIVAEQGGKTLYMEGPYAPTDEHFGQMALLVLEEGELVGKTQGTASWDKEEALFKQFKKKGTLQNQNQTQASPKGRTYTGALNLPIALKPGEKKEIHMVLAWYFPNGKNGGHRETWDAWGKGKWEGDGNYYATHFKGIKGLSAYIRKHHKRLLSQTASFTDAFYSTNLPYWLVERIGNQLNILHSRTIFHDKNDYVGLWEGAGAGDGSCAGNCNHVWHYPQAHARLFPQLAKRIKNQTFKAIKADGQIPYRQPAGSPAFDGQCGDIIGSYREYLLSTDVSWLKDQYPAIKKAMEYLVAKHDADQDGWLSDAPKHTTYDASMSGNPSFLTSLYQVALLASEKMGLAVGDQEGAALWKAIAEKSIAKQEDQLWNGEYYIQLPGQQKATDYENGCHADQLLGQWWADQIGLGSLYADYRIKSATEAVLKYNFKANLKDHVQVSRKFALATEPAMVVTTWPNKDRTPYASGYSDELWPTYEYTIGSALFKYGLHRDALTLLHSGHIRYDGQLRKGYKTANGWGNFGFSGNPFGDDECGQFYSRSLSVWSVLLAAQGFVYNGPEGQIGFDPKWKPEDHNSFFTTAAAWGSFSQYRRGMAQQNTLALKYGTLQLNQISLQTAFKVSKAVVTLNGKTLKTTAETKAAGITIGFDTLNLKEGDTLQLNFN